MRIVGASATVRPNAPTAAGVTNEVRPGPNLIPGLSLPEDGRGVNALPGVKREGRGGGGGGYRGGRSFGGRW